MNDILFFPVVTTVEDELGQKEEIEDYSRQVFCEKNSASRAEFFSAGQNGIKASCVLIINLFDYQKETRLKYENDIYSVYRTYERSDERIELYCEVRAGG
ncbi:phage head closure protein [Bacillus songklensis]|uniref:Phage head closure protein n=1 Tax=Bacillus songklensis TaxID=1069116 RepID=A0ABV8B3A6_9BACI